MKRVKQSAKNQGIMFAELYVDDRLRKDHEVYAFDELMESIDISEITDSYSKEGGKLFSPRDMIAILLYAYSKGVTSSYKIAKLIESNIDYIFLAGGHKISRRTISDFRRKNADKLQKILTSTVIKSIEVGLVKTDGIFSLDGSKFSANASKSKTKTKKGWEDVRKKLETHVEEFLTEMEKNDKEEEGIEEKEAEEMKEIRERIRALKEKKTNQPEEEKKEGNENIKKIEKVIKKIEKIDEVLSKHPDLKDDERINLTDQESRLMKNGTGEFLQGYNGQIVTSNQIIIAAGLYQDENDQDLLVPLLEKLEDNIGQDTKYTLITDAGYNKGKNLKWLASKKNINAYVSMADRREDTKTDLEKKIDKYAFVFDENNNQFICPTGKYLKYFSTKKDKDKKISVYRGELSDCQFCPAVRLCLKNKQEKKAGVKIIVDDGTLVYRKEMMEKMSLPETRRIYSIRAKDVEPVFGNIKHNKGIRRFRMRGFAFLKGEYLLIAAATNISKIITFQRKPLEEKNHRQL